MNENHATSRKKSALKTPIRRSPKRIFFPRAARFCFGAQRVQDLLFVVVWLQMRPSPGPLPPLFLSSCHSSFSSDFKKKGGEERERGMCAFRHGRIILYRHINMSLQGQGSKKAGQGMEGRYRQWQGRWVRQGGIRQAGRRVMVPF